ncbi:putative Polysaccharide lyase [Seiridium cardinale]
MHSVKLALLGLFEYFLGVTATPLFQNHGTTSGWDSFNHENKGTVTQADNVSYEPGTSLKMIQTYDSSWTGRYHSEAIKTNVYTVGDQGFYGFAFRLHSEWDTSSPQTFNVAQTIANLATNEHNTCGDDWIPSMMMWVEGSQLRTRRKGNNMCGTNGDSKWTTGYDYEEYTVGTIQPGVWNKVVIQASWQSDATGFYKVWLNGTKKVEEYNVITTYLDASKKGHFQFSVGLYANSWHDQGKLVGSGDRQLWIDEVGIGSTFADADPDQW